MPRWQTTNLWQKNSFDISVTCNFKVPQSNLIAVVKFNYERMFVFWLFFQFLCHMPQRNFIYFWILLVALSHCDKDLFCLSQWVTATNRFFVCCNESQRHTKFVYVAKRCWKRTKTLKLLVLFWTFGTFCAI